MDNPLMKAVALEDNNAHSIYDLLVAAGMNPESIILNPTSIQITPDLDGPAGNIFIGNSDVSTTQWGFKIVSGIRNDTQNFLGPMFLKSVHLMTDATVSAPTPLRIGVVLTQR